MAFSTKHATGLEPVADTGSRDENASNKKQIAEGAGKSYRIGAADAPGYSVSASSTAGGLRLGAFAESPTCSSTSRAFSASRCLFHIEA